LPANFASRCTGLADFWAAIDDHVAALGLSTRDDIAQLAFFISDTVYKWPNAQLLSWIHRHEQALVQSASLGQFTTIVGWGTGSAFQAHHRAIGRELAFVIDRDPAKWGRTVEGITVCPPSAIDTLDSESTAIVVFSCFYDDIARAIAATGSQIAVLPATTATAERRFQPLVNLVGYFREIERYYPRVFSAERTELAA
jgi:hypothetical protein